jgi:hypothetical protein
MKHTSAPQSISWFQTQYREGRLILRPPFQRKPVWSEKQRSALIESALMNIPIPEVYVQATVRPDGEQLFAVVDGQQRLRTLLQFIGIEREEDREGDDNNGFTLTGLPPSSDFRDVSFADLEGESRTDFFQYEICVRMMHTNNIREVEDVFKRLNKFTMPLKAQELRNATYHGAFARLSEELADDDYWAVNRIVTPAAIRRMADIEMMSDLLIGLLHGPQGGSAKAISSYYDAYEQYDEEFPDQNRVRRLFEQARHLIEGLFADISSTRWGNRADFYSLFVAAGTALEVGALPKTHEKPLKDELLKFGMSVTAKLKTPVRSGAAGRYAAAIEKGSNDKARRAERHDVLMGIFNKHVVEKQGDTRKRQAKKRT